jgi:RNA polymerase sigma-70 factor (ECF subfamily)
MRSSSYPPGGSADGAEAPRRPSFEEVYQEHFAYVFRLLGHLGVPELAREDSAQDVFLVVHRRLPDYEPRNRLRGWLGAIANRIAAKARRREGRRVVTTGAGLDVLDDGVDAVDVDLDHEIASADEVHRVMQDVDPDLRFVFLQHHMADVPLTEIAEHLGVPLGTASTRLRLSRAAVKAAWTRYKAKERHAERCSNVVPILGPLTFMQAGRQIPPVSDEVRARVWAGIQKRIGGGGGGGGDGPPPESPSSAAPRSAPQSLRAAVGTHAGKALTLAVAIGVGVVLGAVWDPLHRPAVSVAPPPPTRAEIMTAAPERPASAPGSPATSTPAAPTATPAAGAPPPSSSAVVVDLDNVLVDRASTALQAGQFDRALASVQDHAARFPGSRRAHDREVVWIAALLRVGRTTEARARLARFEVAYPQSPRLDVFRKALGGP